MLTIAEISGLIAAGVMTVQYILPALIVIILVRYAGTENSAATWSVINRTIGSTVWPHLIRADAVTTRRIPATVILPSGAMTFAAALLILAGVLTPLGLREEIVAGDARSVTFQYAADTGPWGRVTMPRPNAPFNRHCELGLTINCPGQYQGVFMNETEPGRFQSQLEDENSTINITVPFNFTEMFTSATSGLGNTVSGLFDIQYRRWQWIRDGLINGGQPYVRGDSRFMRSLITEDSIVLLEGLIVDMRDNPGIGFRNHTIPLGLTHGGTWQEDITWLEPVTQCADTNLTVEMRDVEGDDFSANQTFYIIDRGAFHDLDETALQSPVWNDNQTLDLFGRAHKAARMHNVIFASSWNITLPLADPSSTVSAIPVANTLGAGIPPGTYNPSNIGRILINDMTGLGGKPPSIRDPTVANATPPFVDHYENGMKKLVALNYTAINQMCRGYYEYTVGNDWRANNLTYPAVQCGGLLGAPVELPRTSLDVVGFENTRIYRKNLYSCATGIRASVKEVHFLYNGTSSSLDNLRVERIVDKEYPDERSQPLWAAEHSLDRTMRWDPLWGIVNDTYENYGYDEGFYTIRAPKFWLATSPYLASNFGEYEGYDALAAASGFLRRLGNLYGGLSDLYAPSYSGEHDDTMLERFQRLTVDQVGASQIPSLILTDGLAAGLVGTKTAISSKMVQWPASLAVDDAARGVPAARVVEYKRVVRYDLRYAIPGFLALAMLLFALLWALGILALSRSAIALLRNMYNQTSAGRLATSLLLAEHANPKQPSGEWAKGEGQLPLSFGQMTEQEKEYFCALGTGGNGADVVVRDEKGSKGPGEDAALLSVQPKGA